MKGTPPVPGCSLTRENGSAIEDAGGRGGEEYVFTAWRRCGDGDLRFEQQDQSELGTPELPFAWAVIDGTRCP